MIVHDTLRSLASVLLALPASPQDGGPGSQGAAAPPAATQPAATQPSATQPARKIAPRSGQVTVAGVATIDLPAGFLWLDTADARHVVEEIWAAAPDPRVLGMILPPSFDVRRVEGWAIRVGYDAAGHVADADAAALDFGGVLADMKSAALEQREATRRAGSGGCEIVDWAAPPQHDAALHAIQWGTRSLVDGVPDETLDYEVRVLGRSGFVDLRVTTEAEHTTEVAAACQALAPAIRFLAGHGYAEFVAGRDPVAPFGIAGLVTGPFVPTGGWLRFFKPWLVAGVIAALILVRVLRRRPPAPARGPAANPAGGPAGNPAAGPPAPARQPPAPRT